MEDSLWQSHDPRYKADEVRIIPGPTSVAGVIAVDEPIAKILARYEERHRGTHRGASAPGDPVRTPWLIATRTFLRTIPYVTWHGNLAANPARVVPAEQAADRKE